MPNWCSNIMTLTHDDPTMITRAKEAFIKSEFLNEFIPVPQDLQIVAGQLGDEAEQKELELKEELNRITHGYTTWYDFCVNEWGTKWDVGGDSIDEISATSITVSFDSAWSPPIAAYEKLVGLGFEVEAMYYEPGMAFAGTYTSEEGDEYYEYGSMTADEITDELPTELDEAFGISEYVAECEDEEDDDEDDEDSVDHSQK